MRIIIDTEAYSDVTTGQKDRSAEAQTKIRSYLGGQKRYSLDAVKRAVEQTFQGTGGIATQDTQLLQTELQRVADANGGTVNQSDMQLVLAKCFPHTAEELLPRLLSFL